MVVTIIVAKTACLFNEQIDSGKFWDNVKNAGWIQVILVINKSLETL